METIISKRYAVGCKCARVCTFCTDPSHLDALYEDVRISFLNPTLYPGALLPAVDRLNPAIHRARDVLRTLIAEQRDTVRQLTPLWRKLAREVPILRRCTDWACAYLQRALYRAQNGIRADGDADGDGNSKYAVMAAYDSDEEFKSVFAIYVRVRLGILAEHFNPYQPELVSFGGGLRSMNQYEAFRNIAYRDVLENPVRQLREIKARLILHMQVIDRIRFILSKTDACSAVLPPPMPFLRGDQLIVGHYYRISFHIHGEILVHGVFQYLGMNRFHSDHEEFPRTYELARFAPDHEDYRICEVPVVV